MGNFSIIQQKLSQFITKYYTNELIKGAILFLALGLLYLIFTLLVEYFLWLPPYSRRLLFYTFIIVEIILLVKYVLIPVSKLSGIKQGISTEEASRIIGRHFPEVGDRLLNILQLHKDTRQTELLLASIEQKAAEIKPVPFNLAVNFKSNIKYLKYLAIPLAIWLFTLITGNVTVFNQSLDRVVHYGQRYEPPAPFRFSVLNDTLRVLEGELFFLRVETSGVLLPENVSIHFSNEQYMLKNSAPGQFEYTFENIDQPVSFYLSANGVNSKAYLLDIVKVPSIIGFKMVLDYPNYTARKDESIENTGNALVPEGTNITWNIRSKQTDSILFRDGKQGYFKRKNTEDFSLTKRVKNTLAYSVSTSNRELSNYETLSYNIDVIKDQFPVITVKSDIDSVKRGPVQFLGQLSDDYGVKKLLLVYYDTSDKESTVKKLHITINATTFESFYYLFDPEHLEGIEPGKSYDLYFEVFDNDAVNGSKSTKSQVFNYYDKTKQEITNDLLKEQADNLKNLNKTARSAEKLNEQIEEFTKKLKSEPDINWNDKKEFDEFLKRQEMYEQMFEKQTDKLLENLEEQNEQSSDKNITEKQQELKKRIEETKEIQERNKLLEELRKMAQKLDRENMLDRLDKLTEKNKQEKRTLERMLELTKRFFVEKKLAQVNQKIDTLAAKQEKLSESPENSSEEQEKLNEQFQDIRNDFKELNKQNNELFRPMEMPDTKRDQQAVEEEMNQATDKLQKSESSESSQPNQQKSNAVKNQKAAAAKMRQMSKSMSSAMASAEAQKIDEDIDNLRRILENLLAFSFDQEKLLNDFENIDTNSGAFPVKLKKQFTLKENFEHIDDSLYTLSLRVVKLSSKIQEDLTEAHYNIDKSLENLAENRINQGRSNQQYSMTAANNLAEMLSNMLNGMLNPNPSGGQGDGKQMQLPDIIKQQQGLQKQMQDGIKKQQGKEGLSEEMSGEQYQIYQQQQQLRKALEGLMEQEGKSGNNASEAFKQMEALEKQLLDKGFTNEVMQNMLRLEHELLKLKEATLEQGEDDKRKSETNRKEFDLNAIPKLKNSPLFFNSEEILNRGPLPLRDEYKQKVQQYFSKDKQ